MITHHSFKIQNVIQQELFAAKHSIKICVAWFTNDLLFQPLLMKLNAGVDVEIILNEDKTNLSNSNKVDFEKFVQSGGHLYWNNTKKLLHHKFCIIDNRVVISGSYNWTNKAEYNHEDVTVYINEQGTTLYYSKMFEKLSQEFYTSKIVFSNSLKHNNKENSHNCSIIEYISSDGNIIVPSNTDCFDGEIISNTYDKIGIIKFNRTISKIGEFAFDSCTSLKKIIIPNGVKTIETQAFHNCSNLIEITIPESIEKIDIWAFKNCTSLERFNSVFASNDGRCLIINNVLTAIASGKLTEFTIPTGVKTIGESVFNNCSQIIKITIPTSVIKIGDWAFSDCINITEITIPPSVNDIGEGVFGGCESLTKIKISDNIKHIGHWAFIGCTSLTEITIPNSVTEIEDGAFARCQSLSRFIGKYASEDGRCLIVNNTLKAFAPYGIIEYVIPEGVSKIGDQVFSCYSNIVDITIPRSVTGIGWEAFEFCEGITSIIVPNGVTTIENSAFRGCKNLSNIILPNGIKEISGWTFQYCRSLTSVVIPDGVIKISAYAFADCDSLSEIFIPDSVKELDISSFDGCNNQLCVYINSIVPPQISDFYWGFKNNEIAKMICKFYVPARSATVYKTSEEWKELSDQIFDYNFSID